MDRIRSSTRPPLPVVLVLLFVAALAPAWGQEVEPVEEEAELWDQVRKWYEAAKERGEKVPANIYDWVKEDLASAGAWEYRVVELEPSATGDVQDELNRLGAERWEVIWVQPAGKRTRFILKRPVRSYLRHISPTQILRLIPGGGGSDE